jgi:hypothetical protein
MKIILENWKDAERDLKQAGIQDVVYDKDGVLQTIISKGGKRYEFSPATIKQLMESGLIEMKLGLRVRHR